MKKTIPVKIIREHLEYALSASPWKFANDILYGLCKKYPLHTKEDQIIAKVWLIGRSYAASIERGRRGVTKSSDKFYEDRVGKGIFSLKLDSYLKQLPKKMNNPWGELSLSIKIHKILSDEFNRLTGLNKRSLASKYLHFHNPNLFYIFDSRANHAAKCLTPRITKIQKIKSELYDATYLNYCRRCQWLVDNIEHNFQTKLTPRQLDRMLLVLYDKLK